MHTRLPRSKTHQHHQLQVQANGPKPGSSKPCLLVHPYLRQLPPQAIYRPDPRFPSDEDIGFFERFDEFNSSSLEPVKPSKPSWKDVHGEVTPIVGATFPLPVLPLDRFAFIQAVGMGVLSLFQAYDPTSTLDIEKFYAKDAAAYLCCGPDAGITLQNLPTLDIAIFLTISSQALFRQDQILTSMKQGALLYLSHLLGYGALLPEAMLSPYISCTHYLAGDHEMGLDLTIGKTTFSFVFHTLSGYTTDSRSLLVSMKTGLRLSLAEDYQRAVDCARHKIISRPHQAPLLIGNDALYPWQLVTKGHRFEDPTWVSTLFSIYAQDHCFIDHLTFFLKKHQANDPMGQIALLSNLSLYALWDDSILVLQKLAVLMESLIVLTDEEKEALFKACPLLHGLWELLLSSTWRNLPLETKKDEVLALLLPHYLAGPQGCWQLRSPPPSSPRGPIFVSLPRHPYASLEKLHALAQQPSSEELWHLWEEGAHIALGVVTKKESLEKAWPALLQRWFIPSAPKLAQHTLSFTSPPKDWLYLLGQLPRTSDLVPHDPLMATKLLWMAFLTSKNVSSEVAIEWWNLVGALPFLSDPLKAQALLASLSQLHPKLPKALAVKKPLTMKSLVDFLFQYYNFCAQTPALASLLDGHVRLLQELAPPMDKELSRELMLRLAAHKSDPLKEIAWHFWLHDRDCSALPEVLLSKLDMAGLSSLEKEVLALRLLSIHDHLELKVALFKTVYEKGLTLPTACQLFSALAKDKRFKEYIDRELSGLCTHFLPLLKSQEELSPLLSLVTSLSPGNYQAAEKIWIPLFSSLDIAHRSLPQEDQHRLWGNAFSLSPHAFYYYVALHLVENSPLPETLFALVPTSTFTHVVHSLALHNTPQYLDAAWQIWCHRHDHTFLALPEAVLVAQCQRDLSNTAQVIFETTQLLEPSNVSPEEKKALLKAILTVAQSCKALGTFHGVLQACAWLDRHLLFMTASQPIPPSKNGRAAQKPLPPSQDLQEIAHLYLELLTSTFTYQEEPFLGDLLALLVRSMQPSNVWNLLTPEELAQPLLWITFSELFQRLEKAPSLLPSLKDLLFFFLKDEFLKNEKLAPYLISTLASAGNSLLAIRAHNPTLVDTSLEAWLAVAHRTKKSDQLLDLRAHLRLIQLKCCSDFEVFLNALNDYLTLPNATKNVFEMCLQQASISCHHDLSLLMNSLDAMLTILQRAYQKGFLDPLERLLPQTQSAYLGFLDVLLQKHRSKKEPLQLARGIIAQLPSLFSKSESLCTPAACNLMVNYLNTLLATPGHPRHPEELVSWVLPLCTLTFVPNDVRSYLCGSLVLLLMLTQDSKDPKSVQLVNDKASLREGLQCLQQAIENKWLDLLGYKSYLTSILLTLVKSRENEHLLTVWKFLKYPEVFQVLGSDGPLFIISMIKFFKDFENFRLPLQNEFLQPSLFSIDTHQNGWERYENAWIVFFQKHPLDYRLIEAYQDFMVKAQSFIETPLYRGFCQAQELLSALYTSLKNRNGTLAKMTGPLTLSLFGQTFAFDKRDTQSCQEFCALAMADLFFKQLPAIVQDANLPQTAWYDLSAALTEVQTPRTLFAATYLWMQRAKAFIEVGQTLPGLMLKEGSLFLKFHAHLADRWPALVPYLATEFYPFLSCFPVLPNKEIKPYLLHAVDEFIARQKLQDLEASRRLTGLTYLCDALSLEDRHIFLCRLATALPGVTLVRLPFVETSALLALYSQEFSGFTKKQQRAVIDWMQEVYPHLASQREELTETERSAQLDSLAYMLSRLLSADLSLPEETYFSSFLAYSNLLQRVHTQEQLEKALELLMLYCPYLSSPQKFTPLFARWITALLKASHDRDAILIKVLDFLRHLQVTCLKDLWVVARKQIDQLGLLGLLDPQRDQEFYRQYADISLT